MRKARGSYISKVKYRINHNIRAREVRLIDAAGKQVGIVPLRDALRAAQEQNLDLVEVAPNAKPPVCRLMDYGKFLYEQTKRQRVARKSQKATEVKEIRLGPKTGDHDLQTKLKRAREFLDDGAKVKVRVRFRGREITHPEIGLAILKNIATQLEDVATIEQMPRMEGRSLLMILTPNR